MKKAGHPVLYPQTYLRALAGYSQDLMRHALLSSLSAPMSAANDALGCLSHLPLLQNQQGIRLACACTLWEPFAEEGSELPPLGPNPCSHSYWHACIPDVQLVSILESYAKI